MTHPTAYNMYLPNRRILYIWWIRRQRWW